MEGRIIGVFILTLSLVGCGTMDEQVNKLQVGDSAVNVRTVMGEPDKRHVNGTLEAWQYCISGSRFGENDHKDLILENGKLIAINAYVTPVTGCRNGMRPIAWPAPAAKQYSIADAKQICKEFGFSEQTDAMANCLLQQHQSHQLNELGNQRTQLERQRLEVEQGMANQSRQQQTAQHQQLLDLERQRQQQQQQQQMFQNLHKPAVTCTTRGYTTTCF